MVVELKKKIYTIVIGTDTPAGKLFDVLLIIVIFLNTSLIILESVDAFRLNNKSLISVSNLVFLILFSVEYVIRLWLVNNKKKYVFSFLGIIDFWAIVPNILVMVIPSIRVLSVVRIFRLLRLFSIFKMGRYIEESGRLMQALKASKPKIIVFVATILSIIVLVGALMYIIEGPDNGFVSIPESMYWAVVTISTVGYGDISPQTPIGKIIASFLMIVAYGIIAVPTGIISHEFAQVQVRAKRAKNCPRCEAKFSEADDLFCSKCGERLENIMMKNIKR